jgi:uncharacterized protein
VDYLDSSSDYLPGAIIQILRERSFPPVHLIDILIAEDCNCRCDYCFVHGKRPKRMTEEIVKATVDFALMKSRDYAAPEILFLGGEPLLAFDLMQLAVDYGNWQAKRWRKTLKYSMTTNGTLFDEEKLRFCRNHRIKFMLSMDGDKATHNAHRKFADGRGTYDAVASKIQLMKQYQPWLGARVTPTPKNLNKMAANVEHLHSLGLYQFIIGPASGLEYSEEDAAEYKKQLRKLLDYYIAQRKAKAYLKIGMFEKEKDSMPGSRRGIWGCGAGRTRISVSASGEIQPCAKVQGLNNLAGISEYSLGNVLTGFRNFDARREFISFNAAARKRCLPCCLQCDCAGGCPAVNYEYSKSIHIPDPNECRLLWAFQEFKAEAFAKLEAEGLLSPSA